MIHAEIMERCVQLGIITSAAFNPINWNVSMNFSNGTTLSSNLSDVLYASIIFHYKNFQGNSNWQHEIFDVTGYRQGIANNLSETHPYLDNYSNPFENNLNTGQIIPLTMEEYFDLISWGGLQGTAQYNSLSDLEKAKINQAFSQTQNHYNENCN